MFGMGKSTLASTRPSSVSERSELGDPPPASTVRPAVETTLQPSSQNPSRAAPRLPPVDASAVVAGAAPVPVPAQVEERITFIRQAAEGLLVQFQGLAAHLSQFEVLSAAYSDLQSRCMKAESLLSDETSARQAYEKDAMLLRGANADLQGQLDQLRARVDQRERQIRAMEADLDKGYIERARLEDAVRREATARKSADEEKDRAIQMMTEEHIENGRLRGQMDEVRGELGAHRATVALLERRIEHLTSELVVVEKERAIAAQRLAETEAAQVEMRRATAQNDDQVGQLKQAFDSYREKATEEIRARDVAIAGLTSKNSFLVEQVRALRDENRVVTARYRALMEDQSYTRVSNGEIEDAALRPDNQNVVHLKAGE